jgi:hypothetical protein
LNVGKSLEEDLRFGGDFSDVHQRSERAANSRVKKEVTEKALTCVEVEDA